MAVCVSFKFDEFTCHDEHMHNKQILGVTKKPSPCSTPRGGSLLIDISARIREVIGKGGIIIFPWPGSEVVPIQDLFLSTTQFEKELKIRYFRELNEFSLDKGAVLINLPGQAALCLHSHALVERRRDS
ncbi:hypothetical protein QAD02_020633 [Eretmocerus hayati]|uniref:Uncharacterized protein n=1 Tax=Eretmocerus hayati TaxID=131215 RepID=A0ACC2PSS2_9HYME|nr:hypothetical protein QAD02_020633 [Eretmocerus hayati]